ncbi:MAG: DUF427 domain-containing protein [Pseudomonadota bacterium]
MSIVKASWQGAVIASSDATVVVEGNHYFPADAVDSAFLEPSSHTSVCGWKGTANYYDIVVDGQRNANAAWYYANPKSAADNIRNYVAFWKGVAVG